MQCPFQCRLSELKKYVIYDAEGQDIGDPIDFGLNTKKKLAAEALVIGGGIVEEILEELEIRDNIDEFVYFNQIESIEQERINLKITEQELQKTTNKGELPENLIRFQDLMRRKVQNRAGEIIGDVIDLYIDSSGTYLILSNTDFNANMRFTHNYEQRFTFIVYTNELISLAPLTLDITQNAITTYILNNYKSMQSGTTEVPLKKISNPS